MGAWIEIGGAFFIRSPKPVAPLVGAWIEINECCIQTKENTVAPLVGAWIEIVAATRIISAIRSLPLWERGLKCVNFNVIFVHFGRSPCGSVD